MAPQQCDWNGGLVFSHALAAPIDAVSASAMTPIQSVASDADQHIWRFGNFLGRLASKGAYPNSLQYQPHRNAFIKPRRVARSMLQVFVGYVG